MFKVGPDNFNFFVDVMTAEAEGGIVLKLYGVGVAKFIRGEAFMFASFMFVEAKLGKGAVEGLAVAETGPFGIVGSDEGDEVEGIDGNVEEAKDDGGEAPGTQGTGVEDGIPNHGAVRGVDVEIVGRILEGSHGAVEVVLRVQLSPDINGFRPPIPLDPSLLSS